MFQRLQASLELSVYDIFSSATDSGVIADVSSVAVAARLVEDKVGRLAADLEAFAGHARRSTVNTDDVKLLARNNSKLVSIFIYL